jgi:RNA polymerase sigma factor (sigma-70 family)
MDFEALLAAVRDRKPDAWEALFPRLHRELRVYFRREFDGPTAAELMDRTVEIVIHSLPGLEPDESLRQWVFGVARNLRRKEYESRTRRKALNELAAILWKPSTSPSARVYANEVHTMLLEEIEKLPPYFRAIIENDLEGGDTKEFAERQNISVSTVRTRRFRGIEILRERLSARLEPPRSDSTSRSSSSPPA